MRGGRAETFQLGGAMHGDAVIEEDGERHRRVLIFRRVVQLVDIVGAELARRRLEALSARRDLPGIGLLLAIAAIDHDLHALIGDRHLGIDARRPREEQIGRGRRRGGDEEGGGNGKGGESGADGHGAALSGSTVEGMAARSPGGRGDLLKRSGRRRSVAFVTAKAGPRRFSQRVITMRALPMP